MSFISPYDRLDMVRFCLCHGLVHIGRHLDSVDGQLFLDDFSTASLPGEVQPAVEEESDAWAREVLNPGKVCSGSRMRTPRTELISWRSLQKVEDVCGRCAVRTGQRPILSQASIGFFGYIQQQAGPLWLFDALTGTIIASFILVG